MTMSFLFLRFNCDLVGKDKLLKRQCLDRRRLEEAFLLFAVLKINFEYDLGIRDIGYDRNTLVEGIIEIFREKFLKRWSGE